MSKSTWEKVIPKMAAKQTEKKQPVEVVKKKSPSGKISWSFFCDVIRTVCYASSGARQSHAYGGLSTIGWSIDKDHFLEYSHMDHRAIVNRYGDIREYFEDQEYSVSELMEFLDEYVRDLKYFRI